MWQILSKSVILTQKHNFLKIEPKNVILWILYQILVMSRPSCSYKEQASGQRGWTMAPVWKKGPNFLISAKKRQIYQLKNIHFKKIEPKNDILCI